MTMGQALFGACPVFRKTKNLQSGRYKDDRPQHLILWSI